MGFRVCIGIVLLTTCPCWLLADGYGSVVGRFVYDGDPPDGENLQVAGCRAAKLTLPDDSLVVNLGNRGLANVVLFLRSAPDDVAPWLVDAPENPVKFRFEGHRFVPHVLSVRTGQDVVVESKDDCAHNMATSFIRNPAACYTVVPNKPGGMTVSDLLAPEPLPMPVKCDIHPYMEAFWVIMDHPYVAVTDEDGKFTVEDLPVGVHEFRVWHERAGYLERAFRVEITGGNVNDLGDVRVDPVKLAKKR